MSELRGVLLDVLQWGQCPQSLCSVDNAVPTEKSIDGWTSARFSRRLSKFCQQLPRPLASLTITATIRADQKHPPISKLRNPTYWCLKSCRLLKLQYEFLFWLMFFNDTVFRQFSLFEFVKNILTKLQLKKQSRSWESNENYWRAIQHCRLSVGRGGVALIELVAGKVHELL